MNFQTISRRRFAAIAGAGLLASRNGHAASLTVGAAVARIKKTVGVEWREKTVDTLKTGNPDAPVTGIATTFMSTFDVLKRAAANKKNLIVTHEPTFFNGQDATEGFDSDPIYKAKQDFIAKHNIAIFRFHDHWHMRRPDPMQVGFAEAVGWEKYQDGDSPRRYLLPESTLEALAKKIQSSLKARAVRVIGDPKTPVRRVGLSVGYSTLNSAMRALREVDVFVGGEVREWEAVEYTHDAVTAGEKKGLILVGHAASEDPGMKTCADWLRTFISEVPVEFVPAGEPYWPVK